VYLGGKTSRWHTSTQSSLYPKPSPIRAIPLLFLLTCACASPAENAEPENTASLGAKIETEDYIDVSAGIERARELPIGAFLGEVGKRVQGWTRARLDGNDEQLRLLGEVLEFECVRRQDEIIQQLESGAPRNRALAAVALGFARRQTRLNNDFSEVEVDRGALSLGPLLAAIGDPDPKVAANALMGLGVLARPDTPLAPITIPMIDSVDAAVRSNAAFALTAIVKASIDRERSGDAPLEIGPVELAREACIRALGDSDLGVRTQSAAVLGLIGGKEAIPFLGDRLDDEVALVGQAASMALVRLGRDNPELKGRVARLLADRLDLVRPSRRDTVLYGLVLLAGRQMGDSAEIWQDWARRLPSS